MNSADSLTPASRTFYENTRVKMAASIFIASMGVTSLAYCSIYGGQSDSANQAANVYAGNNDDSMQKSQIALAGGFGELVCLRMDSYRQMGMFDKKFFMFCRIWSIPLLRRLRRVHHRSGVHLAHVLRLS
jgi:hypothetical protein